MTQDAPQRPEPLSDVHFFTSEHGQHMLVADGSRIFDVEDGLVEEYRSLGLAARAALLSDLGPEGRFVDDRPAEAMPIRSLSLAVAQKCNLACGYCYASGGTFGAPARNMEWEVARAAVDRLIADAAPGDRVVLAFLGGEPLINRDLIRRATEYACDRAARNGVQPRFSVTTNGTLVRPDDADFFERHAFAVTVSLDGAGGTHDRLRPYRGGRGSYDAILARIRPLLDKQRRMQVSARVTVTPENLDLRQTLDRFVALGFHSVGFSPMLTSPNGQHELAPEHLTEMLARMIECGGAWEDAVRQSRRYPFSNITTAMQEIHKGTHRPYPCGAGAGYFGVSAEGRLYACHRFVGDEDGRMGDVRGGLDPARRTTWLAERHVHRQAPCTTCWARYLCGGGCHHEVLSRGRPACDYIRGWLDYCLKAYVRLTEDCPGFFRPADGG